MNQEFIIATIVDAGQPVEMRRCRQAPLPDGGLGALWRGLVWPLSADDTIDIAGPAYPLVPDRPIDCSFGLVDGAEEAWLVLEGSIIDREAAAHILRAAGVEVVRTGPWLGGEVDGVPGGGFIRFVRPASDNLRQTLAEILKDRVIPAAKVAADPQERTRLLAVELVEARAELARVKAIAQAPPEATRTLDPELQQLRQDNAALLRENAELRREALEQPIGKPPPTGGAGRLHQEIETLLGKFRPDLRFMRNSLTVAAGEFSDRRSLYDALGDLGSAPLGRGWKKVQAAPGWWEKHVSNGQDDAGRIYVHRDADRWEVLVSYKKQQARDIVWLTRGQH